METYNELKDRQQKEVDAFPFGAAFSKEQFDEMRKKLPLEEGDKYYSLGAGVFVRGKDIPAMKEMFARHKKEKLELRKNTKTLYDGFIRELFNHEYIYAEDDVTVLGVFGYTLDDLEKDKELGRIYAKAVKDYFKQAQCA